MLERLLQLYPTAVTHTPPAKEAYIALLVEQQWLYIPREVISDTELALLQVFLDVDATTKLELVGLDKTWYDFLYHHATLPNNLPDSVRFLHLQLISTPMDTVLWRETLAASIEGFVGIIPLDVKRFVCILDGQTTSSATFLNSLNSLLNSLNADFELTTFGCLGQIYEGKATLPERYQQEVQLLESFFVQHVANDVVPLTALLLNHISHNIVQQLPALNELKRTILQSIEYSTTIQALIACQGNLSQTADKLFIHRNTLTYRLNKFMKETGFNLQYLPDLMICYLLL